MRASSRRLLLSERAARAAHASGAPIRNGEGSRKHYREDGAGMLVRAHPGPAAVELRNFLASEDDAMRQLRRSGLFVANGSHPAKSPVGATFSASMPLLRSFGFLPFAFYKYIAPMGLKKVPCPLTQCQRGRGEGPLLVFSRDCKAVTLAPH